MTVHNNHFTTHLPATGRPAAAEKPAAPAAATTAATAAETAAPAASSPVGLVGNHVDTTA